MISIVKKINKFRDKISIRKAKFTCKSLLTKECRKNIRVFATTVIRRSKDPEITGYLLELDWANNQVKRKFPIPVDTTHPFWNQRGGNRGGRGVFEYNGILYVATAMSILKFDRNMEQIGELNHPYIAGLHEMYINHEGIWLTSTIHDLVVKIDFDGNIIDEWWGSNSQVMQKAFGFLHRKLNLKLNFGNDNFNIGYDQYCKEERLHINSVWAHNGSVYILSNGRNAFIKIRPEPENIIIKDNRLGSPHNGVITNDNRIIINDTVSQCIRTYSLSSGKFLSSLLTPIYKGKRSDQFVKEGWQRGLAHVEDSTYLIGTSPATIFEVNIDKEIIGQVCKIDNDVRHCIHGLTVTRFF